VRLRLFQSLHAIDGDTLLYCQVAKLRSEVNTARLEQIPNVVEDAWIRIATQNARDAQARIAWRPIETAPTDGTNVLLWWPFWCKGRPTIGWFGYHGIQQWVAPEALEGDGDGPTHWMPLPSPPQVTP
jgi:hypothetical protein